MRDMVSNRLCNICWIISLDEPNTILSARACTAKIWFLNNVKLSELLFNKGFT